MTAYGFLILGSQSCITFHLRKGWNQKKLGVMVQCAGCGEREASRLECPNCKKYASLPLCLSSVQKESDVSRFRLGIPGSFFCDQECFKKSCESKAESLLPNAHRAFAVRGMSTASELSRSCGILIEMVYRGCTRSYTVSSTSLQRLRKIVSRIMLSSSFQHC